MNVENQTVEQQEKIGMTDGDDRNDLQPTCMRVPSRDAIANQITKDLQGFLLLRDDVCENLANYLYELGYRK